MDMRTDMPVDDSMRLRGRALVTARIAWMCVAVLAIGMFIAAAALNFAQIQVVCPTATCVDTAQITAEQLRMLERMGLSPRFYATYDLAINVFTVSVFAIIAAMIFWRKSDNGLGLFGSLVLLVFGAVTFTGTRSILTRAYPSWWLPPACVDFVGEAGFLLFMYLFPDGRLVPRWTRWLALGWVAFRVPATFFPDAARDFTTSTVIAGPLWMLFLGGVIASQIYRYRRVSSPMQRQQTKWVVFGITAALSGFLVMVFLIPTFFPALEHTIEIYSWMYFTPVYVFILLIPISIGVAILRYRLWDIDVIINRTLVYGALTASVIGLYVLLVGYLGALFQTGGNLPISLAATGLVAVLFQPLRARVQRGVNRLLYGERDDPYAVLSRLGQRLEATLAPAAVLPTIVETVAHALHLPYAAIALDHSVEFKVLSAELAAPDTQNSELRTQNFDIVASYGEPPISRSPGHLVTLPLVYQGELVGQLMLAPRAPGEPFTAADRRLLDDLARQAGVAAHAVRLTADLQRSRARLVAAREEERRRLRRDLHDGLSPQLASLTLKLDAARNLLGHNPPAAKTMLDELKGQTQGAIADIRRLVYALRPPALDDLGLFAALRQQIAQYQHDQLRLTIDAPERLPPLPAAVEVAAYRIVLEAITNVVRHAHARSCAVSLGVGNGLHLDIRDDGRGIPADRRPGVGLSSMRERAAELGGKCEVGPAPGGGTSVVAWLPLS